MLKNFVRSYRIVIRYLDGELAAPIRRYVDPDFFADVSLIAVPDHRVKAMLGQCRCDDPCMIGLNLLVCPRSFDGRNAFVPNDEHREVKRLAEFAAIFKDADDCARDL